MTENLEEEYEKLIELGKKAGISDMMEFYGNYQEFLNETKEFYKLSTPEKEFSTTNYTCITED